MVFIFPFKRACARCSRVQTPSRHPGKPGIVIGAFQTNWGAEDLLRSLYGDQTGGSDPGFLPPGLSLSLWPAAMYARKSENPTQGKKRS